MGLFKSRGKHVQGANAVELRNGSTEELAEIIASNEQASECCSTKSGVCSDGSEISSASADCVENDNNEVPDKDVAQLKNNMAGKDASSEQSSNVQLSSKESSSDQPSSKESSSDQFIQKDFCIDPLPETEKEAFVVARFQEVPKKKRHRVLKACGITMGVLAIMVLIVYIAGVVVFSGRFFPHTILGNDDISFKSDAEVIELINNLVADYSLAVVGNGFSCNLTGKDVGLFVDANSIVGAIHSELNAWKWPVFIMQTSHDETSKLIANYERSLFEKTLNNKVTKYNETAKDPVNATIVYDQRNNEFIVKPEQAGTKLDSTAVLVAVCEALYDLNRKVVLGDGQLIQPAVLSTDEKLIEAANLATGMISAKLTLLMDDQPVGEINGETLSSFILVNENYEVMFNEEDMNAWVEEMAAGFNTIGTERVFQRADGKEIAVRGGVYGWEIDTEALKEAIITGITAGETASIEVPCSETAQVFNGPNQRDWGNRYIDVDISEQYVRFYGSDNSIIWEAPCISGSPDGKHDTVKGVWVVNAKESPSKLIGYENGKKIYETSVKYWMPFEGNGIGFHDATWQPSFGGSMYANGYGSHGCVNLSYASAEALYGIIETGDVVVVHG